MKLFDLKQAFDSRYEFLNVCMEFLAHNGGSDIRIGRHEVNDKGVFVSVSEYQTKLPKEGVWEAHKDYADLQVVLSGEECIHVSDLRTMQCGKYVKEKDFLPCEGETETLLHMTGEKGLLLLPEDAHMPSMSVNNRPSKVKKAVFKIPMTYLRKNRKIDTLEHWNDDYCFVKFGR